MRNNKNQTLYRWQNCRASYQLQKNINMPQQVLPTAQKILDQLLSTSSEMSSRCSSSLSLDALSTMTAVTSFIDDDQEYDGSRDSNPQLHLTIPISSSPDLTMPRKSNFQNSASLKAYFVCNAGVTFLDHLCFDSTYIAENVSFLKSDE